MCEVQVIAECLDGNYGNNCTNVCSQNCAEPPCIKTSGACPNGKCVAGYNGSDCLTECPDGSFGPNCIGECSPHCAKQPCDKYTDNGECPDGGCLAGYDGGSCTSECPNGTYGANCVGDCSDFCLNPPCDKFTDTGTCPGGVCMSGYDGSNCTKECEDGTYGSNCNSSCSDYCKYKPCDKFTDTGECPDGQCMAGYQGEGCHQECNNGTFGENCVYTCSPNCVVTCLYTNGTCYGQCVEGFSGHDCTKKITDGTNVGAIVGGIIAIIILALLVVAVLFLRNRQSSNRNGKDNIAMEDIIVSNNEQRQEPEGSSNNLIEGDQTYEQLDTAISNKDIQKYVARRKKEKKPFNAEYHSIPTKVHPYTVATLPQNKPKNKYKNIMPYDNNRVFLEKLEGDEFSDYINASYIKDYHGSNSYIACSGITQVNMNDFWRMIWQYKVSLIVMVTNLVEESKVKCDKYWPSEETKCYGDISVELKDQVIGTHYTKRLMLATKEKESLQITQYQYTVWPDKNVPENLSGLCKIREVMKSHRETRDTPVVIHCSAGVGRTGTIISLDILLEQSQNDGHIDIYDCVSKLREQRMYMVQTPVQYVFLHDALNELITVGSTEIQCQELQEFVNSQKGNERIRTEYKLLEDVRPVFTDDDFELGKFEYKDRNRDLNIIAADQNRVVLLSTPEVYINAVYVKGNLRKFEFVATQVPLSNSVDDFWKMVYEQKPAVIVCLEGEPCSSKESWLPEKQDNNVKYDNITVNMVDTTKNDNINIYDITLSIPAETVYANVNVAQSKSSEQDELHQLRVYDVSRWSDPDCEQASKLKTLIDQVDTWVNKAGSYNPIIVMCLNGTTRCGPYIALSRLLSQADIEQYMDVFHVVKEIRINRPQFVGEYDDYKFLYTAMAELAKQT